MITLSGIQPSGQLHLGNYFGAIHQHVERQQSTDESFYFIANYHSLTSLHDGAALAQYSLDVAIDYLALGLDPTKCTLYLQSDVPETIELAWILSTFSPVSLMEKGVAYKDKIAQGLTPNIGLFSYPILQAADILIMQANVVPVGEDQKQNIEIARDLAQKVNHAAQKELCTIPEPRFVEKGANVPGTDGKKMSKSSDNTIPIFAEGKTLKKTLGTIVTDSKDLDDPKDPETCTVYKLINLFATPEVADEIAEAYRNGGYGYGHAKQALQGLMDDYFGEARQRRHDLSARPDDVMDILREGGRNARRKAMPYMDSIRDHFGLLTSEITSTTSL
jgi:tryptophanyl-tRNA synthetase